MQLVLNQIKQSADDKFIRRLVWLVFFYVNVYVFYYYFLDAKLVALINLVIVWTFTPMILWLESKSLKTAARMLFSVVCVFIAICPRLGIPQNINLDYYLLVGIITPTILFKPNEKFKIFFAQFLWGLAVLFITFVHVPMFFPDLSPKEFPVDFYNKGNLIGAFIMLGIVINFLLNRLIDVSNVLEQVNKKQESILDSAGLGVWDWDLKSNKVNFDERWLGMLGLTHTKNSDLLSTWDDLVHPEDKANSVKQINDYIDGKTKSYTNIHRLKHTDGSWVWVLDRGNITEFDKSGKPSHFIGTHYDISALKKNEMELALIYRVLDTSVIVSVTDAQGIITSVNDNFCEISGYTRQELIGKTHKVVNSGRHSEEFFKQFWKTISAGKTWVGEIQNRTKQGKIYFVYSIIYPILDTNGKISKFVSIRFDITKEKEVGFLLEEAQAVAKIGSWSIDLATKKIIWSKQLFKMFDLEATSSPPTLEESKNFVHPDEQELWLKNSRQILRDEKSPRERYRVQLKNKQTIHVESIRNPIFDSRGQPIAIRGTIQDITDLVLAEESAKLERSKAMHNSKLASLGEMSAGVAHEINNPLLIIMATAWSLPKFVADPEKLKHKIENINKAAERISKIVTGLRKFSRSSDKKDYKINSLKSIVDEALIITSSKSGRFSVPVTFESTCEGNVYCDEIEIEQVSVNLINNAIDAIKNSQEEKWVQIKLFENETHCVLQFIDSGHGIPPEVQEKLFQPFFTTKIVGEGTGLGLSIVKGIIDEHQATIEVLNEAPHTTFEIRFRKDLGHVT